jgi:hypothetical protein
MTTKADMESVFPSTIDKKEEIIMLNIIFNLIHLLHPTTCLFFKAML